MELFSLTTAWQSYLAAQLSIAEIDERSAQRQLSIAEAQVLITAWTGAKDERVTVAKAERSVHPDVLPLAEEVESRHAYRKLVAVIYNSVDKDSFLLSRELSRRTDRGDRENRSARWKP